MRSGTVTAWMLVCFASAAMADAPDLSGRWSLWGTTIQVVQAKDTARWQREDQTCTYSTIVTWDGVRFVGVCARRLKASDCVTCLKIVVAVKDAFSATYEESAMDERCDVKLSHRAKFDMRRHLDRPTPWLARPAGANTGGATLDDAWLTHARNGKEANETLLTEIRRATDAATARADTKAGDGLKKAEAELLSRGLPPVGVPDVWHAYKAYVERRGRSEAALAEQYLAVAGRLAQERKFAEAAAVDEERKRFGLTPRQAELPSNDSVVVQYEGALRRPLGERDLPMMKEAWAAHDAAVRHAADELAEKIEAEIDIHAKAMESTGDENKNQSLQVVEQLRDSLAALTYCGSLPRLEIVQGVRHAAEDEFLRAAESFVRRFEELAGSLPRGSTGQPEDTLLAARVKQEHEILELQLTALREAKKKREEQRLAIERKRHEEQRLAIERKKQEESELILERKRQETEKRALERAMAGPGLVGEYFAGTDLNPERRILTRVDLELSRDFKKTPVGGPVPKENFSIRWSGFLTPAATDTYTFRGYSDDGVRITVDGRVVLDEWRGRAAGFASESIDLKVGESRPITIEYFDGGQGQASLWLEWQGEAVPRERLPAKCLSPRKDRAANSEVELCELTVVPSQPVTVERLVPGAERLSGGYKPAFEAVSAHLHGAEYLRVEWQQTEGYEVTVTKPGLLYLVGEDQSLTKDPRWKWESADAELAGPYIKFRHRTHVSAGESFTCKGFELTLVAKKIALKK